jgi:hypothetical protein
MLGDEYERVGTRSRTDCRFVVVVVWKLKSVDGRSVRGVRLEKEGERGYASGWARAKREAEDEERGEWEPRRLARVVELLLVGWLEIVPDL